MGFSDVKGIDALLAGPPPLVGPPLSLLSEARSLVDIEGMVAKRQSAYERLNSATQQLEAYDNGDLETGDQPGEADSEEDARKALLQQISEYEFEIAGWDDRIAAMQRWESQFVYLPELSNAEAMSIFAPDTPVTQTNLDPTATGTKPDADNQPDFYWYDPFEVVGLDRRSAFGWPNEDYESRMARAERALRAHEPWQCEREFWGALSIPTNYHLTASPDTPTSSPHRTIDAWPNPTAVPGSVLGTALSLSLSLAALDQSIADSDAGTGMIHATPFIVQKWAQVFPYLRDPQGNIRTVNNNLIVPGYGYPGTGPDQADRSLTDVTTTSGSAMISSASAAWSSFDLGRNVIGIGIPDGAVIVTITSSTEVVLSVPATADGSDVDVSVPGQGGDATAALMQWAYATEQVYKLNGDVMHYPYDLREMSPALPVNNDVPVRAERTWAFITNRLLRSAVLVDSTTV